MLTALEGDVAEASAVVCSGDARIKVIFLARVACRCRFVMRAEIFHARIMDFTVQSMTKWAVIPRFKYIT